MGKETITYSCGHTEVMNLYGAMKDRDRKVAYYKTILCPECRAKAAAEEARSLGLPELTGSSKQVAWAYDIRSKALKLFGEIVDAGKKRGVSDADIAVATAAKDKWIAAMTDAQYWVEERYSLESPSSLVKEMNSLK